MSTVRKSRLRRRPCSPLWWLCAIIVLGAAGPVPAQENASDQELATKLNNPVSSLISVPFQFNWDQEYGPDRSGHKFQLNVQPVIPVRLTPDWNLIARVIVPVVEQRIPFLGDGSQSGIGDVTGEFFFAPAKPSENGIIWGVGPALLIPTGTDFISADKWALGPTGVVVRQHSGWTYGALANHLWSVGGSEPQNISSTFLQPLVSYTTQDAWTFGLNAEATYDWKHDQWTLPLNVTVSKLTRIGRQPLSIGAGARYYADSPTTGPHGWGARLTVTLLFPE